MEVSVVAAGIEDDGWEYLVLTVQMHFRYPGGRRHSFRQPMRPLSPHQERARQQGQGSVPMTRLNHRNPQVCEVPTSRWMMIRKSEEVGR